MPVRSFIAFFFLPLALILVSACHTRGFQCGIPLASDPDATYTCERPEEVCVCATRSCAKKEVAASDAEDPCPNGLRYVSESDFLADEDLQNKCVDKAHEHSVIDQLNGVLRCPFSPPLPENESTAMNGSTSSSTSGGTAHTSPSSGGTTMMKN